MGAQDLPGAVERSQQEPPNAAVHMTFVLLLLPSGSNRVTGQLSNLPKFTSDKTVSDDIAKILATSTKKKRRKKKKKKKKNQPAAAPAETAAPEEAAAPSLPAP